MGRYKNNIVINILVLIMASFYLLVAVSHISFLKNSSRGYKKSHIHSNSAFKRKIEVYYSKVDNVSLIKLLDKTTIEEKKTFHDFIQFTAEFFVTILFILTVWQLKLQSYPIKQSRSLLNYQECYLSLCSLRI